MDLQEPDQCIALKKIVLSLDRCVLFKKKIILSVTRIFGKCQEKQLALVIFRDQKRNLKNQCIPIRYLVLGEDSTA